MANKKTDVQVDIGGSVEGLRAATEAGAKYIGNFARDAKKSFHGLSEEIFSLRGALTSLAAGFSIKEVIDQTIEAERVQALLQQTLVSTERSSEFTSAQLLEMADNLSHVSTAATGTIADGERMLLTFRRIGQQEFPAALKASLDLSQALGIDLPNAAQTVGRALDDPIKGTKLLRSVNIQLSTAQQETIKRMVETGHAADAQQLILQQLQKAYGGAAEAAANTFGGALAQLKNTVNDLLEGSGGSLSDATAQIKELTAELQRPEIKQGFATFTGAIITAVGWLAKFGAGVADGATKVGTLLANMQGFYADDGIDKRLEAIQARIDKIRNASGFFAKLGLGFSEDEASARDRMNRTGPDATYDSKRELALLQREFQDLLNRKSSLAGAGSTPEAAAAAPAASPAPFVDPKIALQAYQAQIQALGVLLADFSKRTQSQLDDAFQQNLISFKGYYTARANLEQAAVEQQLKEQRAALALLNNDIKERDNQGEDVSAQENQRKKLIADITALERQRGDAAVKAAQDQAKAEKGLNDELTNLKARLLDLQGQGAEAQKLTLQQQYRDLLQRLQTENNTEGEALVKKLFDVQVAKAQLDQMQAEYDRVVADMGRAEEQVQLGIDTGLTSERSGRQQILELHEATAARLQKMIPQMQELADATGDPAAIDRLKDMELELQKLQHAASELGMTLGDAIGGGFEEGINALLSGNAGWRGALRALATSIGQSLTQSIAKAAGDSISGLVRGFIGQAQASGGSGLGGLLAGVGALFSGNTSGEGSANFVGPPSSLAAVHHRGGIVGQASTERRMPDFIFAGAPRYHTGGIGGLAPDEVAAVLRKGEEVLPASDPRHRANGGLAAANVTVNISTPDYNSFRRSNVEVAASIGTAVQQAVRRNR